MNLPLVTSIPTVPARGQRGFSLAEVIVVVAIILIASTFALSAYSTHTKSHAVRATAQTVTRALIEAKNRAVMRNAQTVLVFDLDNQAFWIDDYDQSGSNKTAPKAIPPKATEVGIQIVDVMVGSTTSTGGLVSIPFDQTGTNPHIKITMRRTSDDATNSRSYYTVQLHPASDDPRIYPNERR